MRIILCILALSASLSAQLPPEILNRPARHCSAPPVDSVSQGRLWPGGVVPYEYQAGVTPPMQLAMRAAMQEWEQVSPVRFLARAAEGDYLSIKDDTGNWSHVGRIGGRQELGIFNWNATFEMAHQLCHALGFYHEHQRPDRGTFVAVAPSLQNDPNYRIEPGTLVLSEYDFDSVMHGGGQELTVLGYYGRSWQNRIGQRARLSAGDIRGMQIAYGAWDRAPSGYGFPATTTNYLPSFYTAGEFAAIGNSRFGVASQNLMGGTAAIFLISLDKSSFFLPIGTVYADPLQGITVGGTASGVFGAPGVGICTAIVPLPNHPWLIGTRLHLQGFFVEPNLRLGHTHGLWATIQASASALVTCLYERGAYQKIVTDASVGLALWNANQVPGFNYVKTEEFTCGGENHWMVIVQHARTGLEFCLIPGGSFQMGDLRGVGYTWELPVRWVRVEPFLLSRTEVTQGQFTAIMGTSPWQGQSWVKIGLDQAANHIDWYDAVEFCVRVDLRLPSEAEWEYACRAGTVTCYHHGENHPATAALGNYAWYELNTKNQMYAQQVGQKLPNAFGLFDMTGNVFEWCQDRWSSDYRRAPIDGGKVTVLDSNRQVLRGASWSTDARACRSAARAWTDPYNRFGNSGFRLARPLR